MSTNRYEKYFAIKHVMEDLFGSDAWYALKESNCIPTWRKYCSKVLISMNAAFNDSVKIFDSALKEEYEEIIENGLSSLKKEKEIDEFINILAASVIQLSFLQIGLMPRRGGKRVKTTTRKGAWNLDSYRSVQYTQTEEQKDNIFCSKQQKEIGVQNQFELKAKYRRSKQNISYEEWCRNEKNT